MRHRSAVGALVVLACLVGAACAADSPLGDASPDAAPPTSPTAAGTPTPAAEPGDAAAASTPPPAPEFDVQAPMWLDCGGGLECATIQVPLDHAAPDGPLIDLEIIRRPAADADRRIGALLVNPGGPGASGVALARSLQLDDEIHARFDIVGWDPRGVGGSTPLGCNAPLLDFYRLDPSPDSPAEQAELEAAAAAAAESCEESAGELLAHLTTEDTIADLDLVRRALGEEQITYLGYSYGTRIGLGYAAAYGPRVRAMVLDGVFDPTQSLEEWLTDQAVAAEAVIDEILAACEPACGFDTDDVFADVDRLAEDGDLRADGEPVGPAALPTGAIMATYSQSLWDDLVTALDRAEAGDGSGLVQLADLYLGIAGFDAYTAVVCIDDPRPADAAAFAEFADRLAEVAPRVGARVANELLPCAFWPVPVQSDAAAVTAPDAPILVLVASTGDAATPYDGAVRVAESLPNSRLVTFDGAGHTVYGDDACVDELVNRYLVDLVAPPEGAVCPG